MSDPPADRSSSR